MTRAWTALGLGVVTFLWGILGAYVAFNETEGWQLPDKADLNLPQYVKAIYESLPEDLSKYMALAGLTSFVSGLSIGMIWPRIGRVLFHSMAGLTLIVGCGLTCIYYRRPDWIDYLPEQNWAQLVTLFGSVLFGALVQWQVMPRNAGTEKKKKKKSADDLDFEAHQARLNL